MFVLSTFIIAISGFSTFTRAVNLKDLPPPPRSKTLSRRYGNSTDLSCLDLQSEETFIWGAADSSSSAVLGQLQVRMPGDSENILSMERFTYLTSAINCTQTSMDIAFKDDEAFGYAKRVWDWVNGADNHSFVMVAGTGDCGWNTARQPFIIYDMMYDDDANIAHLTANASDWQDAIHSFTLDVGHLSDPQDLTKRGDHDKDITIDFNHDFPINYTSLSVPPLSFGVACSNCATSGEFLVQMHLETILGIPTDMTVGLQPQGVSLEIDPTVFLSADLTSSLKKEVELFAIPLEAITIPGGVLNIGLSVPVTVGVSVGPLQAATNIGGGVKVAIPDNATAMVNILDPNTQSSGWDPIVTTKNITIDARLQGSARAYMNVGPALEIEAVGTGAKLTANIGPMIQVRAAAIASTGAACANDAAARHYGVDLSPTYGIVQNIALQNMVLGETSTLVGNEVGLWIHQLPNLCYPFGEPGSVTDTTTIGGDVPAPTQPPTSVLTGSTASSVYASLTATQTAPAETESASSR
ncbi:uncharacterized protein PV09_02614 [Verruconis gallopava]|uniref:Uncharacterized protein n=1 Tax=Verruconis gallopava TaxID=253628 RepID=A0A0D2AJ73_9PEZI|nr:uncharacterized protein PV09_02614 [Verruconis gallopava]KIW06953.1 hypothetical protein PV09_02614 [Verruconis gallopava]